MYTILLAFLLSINAHAVSVSGGSAFVSILTDGSEIDSNGDGLSDKAKETLGLSIHELDTLGDGIPDYWAIYFGLDPLDENMANQDINGDGLTNYDAYYYNIDPFLLDTDGDGWYDWVEIQHGTDPSDNTSYPVRRNKWDINADGRVNALDIQLIIRAAMGHEIPYPLPNYKKDASAIDVQGVINEAIGINRNLEKPHLISE